MQDRFESVLEAHAARYPAMMPQDYGKLAYQHVFGPEHLVEDAQAVDRLLQEEWETLRPDPDGVFRAEPVGNGLCRLHLAGPWDPAAGKLLGELFCRTAREHSGTAAELAGEIYRGEMDDSPVERGAFNACQNCEYSAICAFDPMRKPRRRLTAKKLDDLL